MATKSPTGHLDADLETEGVEDPDRAVERAYATVSAAVADRLGVDAGTHWELFDGAAEAGLDGEPLAALRRLTELYERAVYAAEAVDPEAARWAVAVATRLEELLD